MAGIHGSASDMAKVGSALEVILLLRFSVVVSFKSIFRWEPVPFRLFADLLLPKLRIDLDLGRCDWGSSEVAILTRWTR